MDDLDAWLDDAPEADWATLVLRRATRGELGDGGRGLLLDLVALGQPYACRSARCSPGMRARAARSCCADLDVAVTAAERAAISAAAPGVDDPFDGEVLRKRHRRCVFAEPGPDGLRCGLHGLRTPDGRPVKPLPCRLFPLAIVDLGDGSRLLTAVHRTTASRLATRPARAFPCLGDGPPLYVSERDTIEGVFGKRVWSRIDAILG
jgi:hypothetical protein